MLLPLLDKIDWGTENLLSPMASIIMTMMMVTVIMLGFVYPQPPTISQLVNRVVLLRMSGIKQSKVIADWVVIVDCGLWIADCDREQPLLGVAHLIVITIV